ncbi:MAG: SIMPL domain-containing protein [Muribaculaceae bacterium]|nr:SIMPL domain-containing protein [Muribaculaceae bacterium]
MKQSSIITGLLIALGLLALGLCIRSGIKGYGERDRVVSVRGLCEKEVEANKVTWPIVTQDMGNDLATLYNRTQAVNAKILQFLKSNGITDQEISVNSPNVSDNVASSYDPSRVQSRYSLTNVIVVTSSDVHKVRSLIERQTELLKEGVAIIAETYQYPTTYEYTDLNKIKPQMIAEATKNAREAANKFGEDSGSRLGRIKTATQGQFSINDRDQFTPYIKTIRVVTYVDYYLQD